MKPFRVLGHSAHPPIVHLPMGLWLSAPLWDALAILSGRPHWWIVSFWSIVLGLAGGTLAIATGLLEYASLEPDHPAGATADRHMVVMLAATGAFSLSALARAGMSPPVGARLVAAVASSLLGAACLSVGGWLGGELVTRYRVGAQEEPKL